MLQRCSLHWLSRQPAVVPMTLWWVVALVFGLNLVEVTAADPVAKYKKAVLIHFEGVIMPLSEHAFYRHLERARAAGADLVIVEIDSPGGTVDSSLALANRLLTFKDARTVAFVRKQAISGAAIMALGCDEIIMAPDALIGDAGPIFQDENGMFRHAPEKIRSILAAEVRKLAAATERPEVLAEAMVDAKLEIFQCTQRESGEARLMSTYDLENQGDAALWEQGPLVPETRKDLFLTLNGRRALELKLSEGLAADQIDLIDRYQLTEDPIILETSAVDVAVLILNNPWVSGLLFVVGLIALAIEFSAPGVSLGGLVAGLCFTLFFWSRFLGGTSGWLEVLLFVAGLLFLLAEIFLIPGVGVAGISGVLLLGISVVLANQDYAPLDGFSWQSATSSFWSLLAASVGLLVSGVLFVRYTGRIPVLERFTGGTVTSIASEPAGLLSEASEEAVDPLEVGSYGITISPLRPAGKIMIGDRSVDVVTEGDFVDSGHQVRILKMEGNRVVVRVVDTSP